MSVTSMYSAQRVNGTGANGNLHVPTARIFQGEWIFFCNVNLKKKKEEARCANTFFTRYG